MFDPIQQPPSSSAGRTRLAARIKQLRPVLKACKTPQALLSAFPDLMDGAQDRPHLLLDTWSSIHIRTSPGNLRWHICAICLSLRAALHTDLGHRHCTDCHGDATHIIKHVNSLRPSPNTSARVYRLARRLGRVPTLDDVDELLTPTASRKR